MSVFAYIRVSTAEQTDGTSLDDQERRIRGLCAAMDQDLARVYCDGGVSGSIPLEKRPAGSELLAALQPGDSLIATKLDRLFRNATDALARSDGFRESGVDLYLLDMGADPVTGNGTARLFFGMLALVAEFERARLRERVQDGRDSKRAKGGHIGGTRPFGYRVNGAGRDAQLIPIPAEQDAIRSIVALHEAGLSLRKIAAQVREDSGLDVSHMTVKRILNDSDRPAV